MVERVPLVLLHGWGFDHHIWDELLPLLQPKIQCIALDIPGFATGDAPVADLQEATDKLLAQLPPRCMLLGWSLGGMLATHIAIQHPQRVAGLITVGSNLKWVAVDDDDWPGASPDNFAAFFENLAQNFAGTQQYFCGVIARGDKNEKAQSRLLRSKLATVPQENFLAGLCLLDSIDNRAGYANLKMPGMHIFGEKDVMVPLSVAERMRIGRAYQQTLVILGAAHQPFLSEPKYFAEQVLSFITDAPYQLDKKQIAQSFSIAAETYDNAAQLQREIGDHLFARLSFTRSEMQTHRVLDLGCGTGVYSARLQRHYPQAQVISLDLAEGMLRYAHSHNSITQALCADAEQLPLANGSIDILYSNLAIQWCQDAPQLFREIHRVLAVNGVAMISTFVEGTLRELREAWQLVDSKIHVNSFAYAEKIKGAAESAGFCSIDFQQIGLVKYYDSVKELSCELKCIGAHNLNAGRTVGLTGKHTLQRMQQHYERTRTAQGVPASYQVMYLVLRK